MRCRSRLDVWPLRRDPMSYKLVVSGGSNRNIILFAMQAAAANFSVVLYALAVLAVTDNFVQVEGRYHGKECHPFSCGHLHNISYPFRRRGNPSRCGAPWYELDCSASKATIQINTGTYYVSSINYTARFFWVVDANLQDANSSCPLPRSDQMPYLNLGIQGSHGSWNLAPEYGVPWASFVNCSQPVTSNSKYLLVDCLSTSSWFVYVLDLGVYPYIEFIEPYCGYLAMIPVGGGDQSAPSEYTNSSDLVKSMKSGFAVHFPVTSPSTDWFDLIKTCLNESISLSGNNDEPLPSTGIKDRIVDILSMDSRFWACTIDVDRQYYLDIRLLIRDMISTNPSLYHKLFILSTLWILKWIAVLCRFVFAPLAMMIFLALKYWKTRIAIDAVEKFLRMQDMLGPKRYAYTDIIAITSHFRDKLGQGGYGSVYKGVLLPGGVHVAIKMLDGHSNCNGEDFINEVATIGRIHHINVVRLMGFCSEEMRRALVYEYMPRGSLNKYIFSSERSFSWDKLNEIALGIARGINYLHQGCDMQILHFDIKPDNILLDDNFVPKVADFGLAKLYPRDKSFVSDRASLGTVGYIAPEMMSRSFGVISSKSDVYSFGMLLLEMAGGRRNADPNASRAYYPAWVYDQLIADQQVDEISNVADMHELERKLCLVGLWCIQMKSHDRPTMSEAIEMLEGGVDALQVPPRPFFCDGDGIGNGMSPPQVMDSYFHSSELTAISEEDDGIAE